MYVSKAGTIQEEHHRIIAHTFLGIMDILDRTVLRMRFFNGESVAEISRMLQLPRWRIEYLMKRGLRYLRARHGHVLSVLAE